MNVLVILGHPRKTSYGGALANAYKRGVEDSGNKVKMLVLADMQFEKNVLVSSPEKQFLENDILYAKECILWADHLVFVYPTWWGNVPALLKAFLDRIIMPGFAFNELQFDDYDKKLAPRTAQLITTMDTPLFVYKYIYGSPGTKAMTNATLKFSGVSPVRKLHLSPIKHSDANQKEKWLRQVYHKGKDLKYGVLTPWERLMRKVMPWIKAIRLQFYIMTFFAYSCGVFAAKEMGLDVQPSLFVLGYLLLFLLEVAVVFSNDYQDRATDADNKYYSMFTGGSRVLVTGLISAQAMKRAIVLVFGACIVLGAFIVWLSPAPFGITIPLILIIMIITMSYTLPPFKFSYRGLGELIVGVTHSAVMIVCGFVFQGGLITDPYPWLLSIPLFLSIVPAIILAGIPDYEADKAAGKGTLAVRMGKSKASLLAIIFIMAAVFSAIFLMVNGALAYAFGNIIFLTLVHGIWLCILLYKFSQKKDKPHRIDGLLALALMYILWFALIPFVRLM